MLCIKFSLPPLCMALLPTNGDPTQIHTRPPPLTHTSVSKKRSPASPLARVSKCYLNYRTHLALMCGIKLICTYTNSQHSDFEPLIFYGAAHKSCTLCSRLAAMGVNNALERAAACMLRRLLLRVCGGVPVSFCWLQPRLAPSGRHSLESETCLHLRHVTNDLLRLTLRDLAEAFTLLRCCISGVCTRYVSHSLSGRGSLPDVNP